MAEWWDRAIRRADEMAAGDGSAASLLAFYARLLRSQKRLYESFQRGTPAGSIERDLPLLKTSASALLRDVADHGPDQLAAQARRVLDDDGGSTDNLLLSYWETRSDREFFAKAIVQPYALWLADSAVVPRRHDDAQTAENRCPRCGGMPQLSILEADASASGDGSGRQLLCATCLKPWSFRRVVCPQCGEEDERKLGYFQSPAFGHVRIDACEACRRYLKTVDLGRFGLAVPLVDEVAAAPLDLWAQEHGYAKIELNLVGL